jgi:hypothetical protein
MAKIKDFQYICQSAHDKPKKVVQQSLVSSDEAMFNENETSDKLDIRVLFQFPYTFIRATSKFPYSIDQLERGISHSFLNVLMTTLVNAMFCVCCQKMETHYAADRWSLIKQAKTLLGLTPLQRVCSFLNMDEDVVFSVCKRPLYIKPLTDQAHRLEKMRG